MQRCLTDLRSNVVSINSLRFSSPLKWPLRWRGGRWLRQIYGTVPAELQQRERHLKRPTATQGLSAESGSWDLVLDGYEAVPQKSLKSIQSPSKAKLSSNKKVRTLVHRKHMVLSPRHKGNKYLTPDQTRLLAVRLRANGAARYRRERPTLISIRSPPRPSAVFSSLWQTNFAKLSGCYDKQWPAAYMRETEALKLHPQTEGWMQAILQRMDANEPFQMENFARQYHKVGREVWSNVAMWLLQTDKHRTIDFLLATHSPLYPPVNWVEDCLQYLAKYMTHLDGPEVQKRFTKRLVHAFTVLANRDIRERLCFENSFVRLLLPHCSDLQIMDIYRTIKINKVKIHSNTWHHLSHRLIQSDRFEQALDALLVAWKTRRKPSLPSMQAFLWNCAGMLRASIRHPAGLRATLRIFENLVAIGIRLNTTLCNIVMLNAVEAGDYDTALSVHRTALQWGLSVDAYTCAILLKLCKARLDDSELLANIVELAIQSGDVRKNKYVATEILHCLALHHTKHNPKRAFASVLEAYAQLFDSNPLQSLGWDVPGHPAIVPRGATVPKDGQPVMEAGPESVGILISTNLEQGTSAEEARRLYLRWRELIEKGEEPFVSLAKTTHTSNAFLQRFTRLKRTLLWAAQVVKDMQRPLPAKAGVKQAEPDVSTWSILLRGFIERGQPKLAEQVLSYMRSKGIQPNQVTWNSLAAGYAGAQDLEGVLQSLRGLEQSGKMYDEFTYAGLRRYRNSDRLKGELEKMRLHKSLDFTSELKRTLGQRVETSGLQEGFEERGGGGGFADSAGKIAEQGSG